MKTLYFDCFAGASGNMILGALIALGVDKDALIGNLKKLDLAKFEIEFSTVDRSGISSIHAKVKFEEEKKHRHLSNIVKIINDSSLSDSVKARAVSIFKNLANAEAGVHGIEVEKVHFHEVGAMDAIIDVVGACIGFEVLGIEQFLCSKIHVGSGFVNMEHGKFPVPPPAVAELLKGIPIYSTEIVGELITPTGAAIISTVCQEFGAIPEIIVEKTAYGAGSREYQDFPNVLRLMVGQSDHKSEVGSQIPRKENDDLTLIETNIDDLSPQILGYVMDRAFEIGCLDCWFTPIQMKKNRPATMISILCESEKREKLTELLYTETSTLGVRINKVARECLPREIVTVKTEFGEIDVKIARYNGEIANIKPEYEQIRQISISSRKPMREIEQLILMELKQEFGKHSRNANFSSRVG